VSIVIRSLLTFEFRRLVVKKFPSSPFFVDVVDAGWGDNIGWDDPVFAFATLTTVPNDAIIINNHKNIVGRYINMISRNVVCSYGLKVGH
jgi:hypothetical protein